MLSVAEGVYELHGAGAIERNAGYQVFKGIGLELAHKLFHAARFELEHAVGVAFGDKLVRARVGISYFGEIYVPAVVLFDIVEALFYIGQRNERKEVHFEHSERLYLLRNKLCGYVVAVARKRNVVGYLFAAYYDACGVHTRLAGHTLYLARHIDYGVQGCVVFIHIAELRVAGKLQLVELICNGGALVLVLFGEHLLLCLLYIEAEQVAYRGLAVHYLGKPVRFGVRHVHNPADVFD